MHTNWYKLIRFDRNIHGNRDFKFLECDYLLVQRYVKPQDCHNPFKILFKILRTLQLSNVKKRVEDGPNFWGLLRISVLWINTYFYGLFKCLYHSFFFLFRRERSICEICWSTVDSPFDFQLSGAGKFKTFKMVTRATLE